jgi:hypothetical protein
MTRSMDEFIEAAEGVIAEILERDRNRAPNTRGAHADVQAALEKCCREWSEEEQKSVAVLASYIAIRGANFSSHLPDKDVNMAHWLHYSFVSLSIDHFLGLPDSDPEDYPEVIERGDWPLDSNGVA